MFDFHSQRSSRKKQQDLSQGATSAGRDLQRSLLQVHTQDRATSCTFVPPVGGHRKERKGTVVPGAHSLTLIHCYLQYNQSTWIKGSPMVLLVSEILQPCWRWNTLWCWKTTWYLKQSHIHHVFQTNKASVRSLPRLKDLGLSACCWQRWQVSRYLATGHLTEGKKSP